MFPRALLKYRMEGGVMQPLFLDNGNAEHALMVKKAIDFYEANLGKEKSKIAFDELRYEVGDDRLADGLTYALEHIYTFTPKRIESAVKRRPIELRLKLLKLVGSTQNGFSKDRADTLKAYAKAYREELKGLSVGELDEYLWSDDPRGHILTKGKPHIEPEEAIRYYNFETLDTLLSNSRSITFTTTGSVRMPKGTFAKKLVREVKELGLIYEAHMQGDAVYVDVYGPVELFGRATRFAWRLSALFNNALPILREASKWMVKVLVHMKRRDLPCVLTNESLPDFTSDIGPDEPVKPIFDSRVERKFYGVMSGVSKYQVEREAEPIIAGDTLIIPDYVFKRPDGVKWYVEIIGFWRPEYTAKKRAKLQELRRSGFLNLILLVDHSYSQYFTDIGFPTFTYRMKGDRLEAPYGSIVNLIIS